MNLGITWQTVLEVGAGLIILFQLGKWIISFGNPIVELRKRLDKHDECLARDKEHLEKIDKSVQRIDEGISVLGLALAEMINHEVSGNDVEKLKQQQEKITTYFYGRKEGK